MKPALTAALLLALACLVASGEEVFKVKQAEKYAAHQRQGDVVVAVKPYRTSEDMDVAFGKAKPYKFGVLPILVVIDNLSNDSLELENFKVRFITADREGLEPLTIEDLTYFQQSTKPKDRPPYLPPVPGLGRPKLKKGPLAKPEIGQRAFKAPVVPPQSSASGFFYYSTGTEPDPIPGAAIYLSGVRNLNTGQDLFYFEIQLDTYKGR